MECVRAPIGKGRDNGALHDIHPVDLLAQVLNAAVQRAGIDKSLVEDVVCGVVSPVGAQGANLPRLAVLKAGFPVTVPAVQVNRMCGSSQYAIHAAAEAIASGDMDIAIGCGVEMMSVVPMGSDCSVLKTGKIDGATDDFPYPLIHQGVSAEMIAEKWHLSRRELEEFASKSHEKAHFATQAGRFASQIVPIVKKSGQVVSADEGIRYPSTVESLSQLKTIFKKNGVITAGVASQISDGASAVLLCSAEKARTLGLRPRARFVARVVVGSDPVMMLDGVIPATQKVLKKAGMKLSDIDVFEINEAFASVVVSWMKELGVDPAKVNPNGGAIAHGHPLGATGGILMTKLVNELERTGKRYGLQTMCIGHGQATATIIENLSPHSKL